jgi:hypothetical protein
MRNPVHPAARPRRLTPLVVMLALAGVAAACAGPAPSAVQGTAAPSGAAVTSVPPTPVLTEVPPATVVPGLTPAASGDPPEPTPMPGGGTTETEWGTILDVIPVDFPVFPGARSAEALDEPASGWLLADAGVDTVASWYRDTLERRGFGIDDLSSPLEDGSRVLDTRTDLPECRIQVVFHPAEGSTIIKVLYGAGCAGGDG